MPQHFGHPALAANLRPQPLANAAKISRVRSHELRSSLRPCVSRAAPCICDIYRKRPLSLNSHVHPHTTTPDKLGLRRAIGIGRSQASGSAHQTVTLTR